MSCEGGGPCKQVLGNCPALGSPWWLGYTVSAGGSSEVRWTPHPVRVSIRDNGHYELEFPYIPNAPLLQGGKST